MGVRGLQIHNPQTLAIIDIKGRIVLSKNKIYEKEITLNLKDYQSGIYFIQLSTSKSKTIKKLIIKK